MIYQGAHNYYDLFTIEPEENIGLFLFQHLIDGQECRLDSKYSRIFTKNANVPISLIGHRLTLTQLKRGSLVPLRPKLASGQARAITSNKFTLHLSSFTYIMI